MSESLTAVWNRRYFGEVTQRELLRSQRHYEPLVLFLLANSSDLDEVLQDADSALYEAKHQGRNRVCISPSCTTPTP